MKKVNKMKKFRFKFVICLVLVLALSMTAATTVSATEGDQIATDTVEAWKYAGGWGIDSSYTANGVCASVPGADTVGSDNAWSYRVFIPNDASISPAFSIADGNKVVIELSVKFFDEQGNSITHSQNGYALDIYIKNAANTDQQLGMLRIWTDSGSATLGNHSCEVYGSDWNNQGAGYWIIGDATESSKFLIQFDRENFISSYVGGQDSIVPLANETLLADRREVLKDVEAIRFEVGGDNGFTGTTEITLRTINGQSLVNNVDDDEPEIPSDPPAKTGDNVLALGIACVASVCAVCGVDVIGKKRLVK